MAEPAGLVVKAVGATLSEGFLAISLLVASHDCFRNIKVLVCVLSYSLFESRDSFTGVNCEVVFRYCIDLV